MEHIKDGYALLSNIKSGGETFQPPLPICFCHQLATAVSGCQPQRVQTSAQSPILALRCTSTALHSALLFLFPEKGGERGDDDLASDTCLVHSQLQVRGGVSPGQYHSTVVARYSPVSYLRNIVSSGCRPAEGPYRPSDLAQTHSGLTGYGPRSATTCTSSQGSGSPTSICNFSRRPDARDDFINLGGWTEMLYCQIKQHRLSTLIRSRAR